MKLWITRDIDGSLCLHDEEPRCSENGVWYSPKQLMHLPKNEYLEITFENSPQQVKLISSEEYKHLKECEEICKIESDYGDKHYC